MYKYYVSFKKYKMLIIQLYVSSAWIAKELDRNVKVTLKPQIV